MGLQTEPDIEARKPITGASLLKKLRVRKNRKRPLDWRQTSNRCSRPGTDPRYTNRQAARCRSAPFIAQ